MGFSDPNSVDPPKPVTYSNNPKDNPGIAAETIPTKDGLSIIFSVTGDMERRVRAMFNVINDGGDITTSMNQVLRIAIDAVELIDRHKGKIH